MCSPPVMQPDEISECMQEVSAAQMVGNQSDLNPAALRALQAAAGTAGEGEVAYVATAGDLQAAAGLGARHIVITDHLDLSSIEAFIDHALGEPRSTLVKLGLLTSTWSIRVRFTTSPDKAKCGWHCSYCVASRPLLRVPREH
jgi:hypothetical protein